MHARYGARAGVENESFLNAGLLRDAFLAPLALYRRKVAALIFEFGTFSCYPTFFSELDAFLAKLPSGYRYAVEVRNPEYLGPAYFDCLRGHGVAHVFNAWTRMPELAAQIELAGAYTADFSVTRALLTGGRNYEQAVAKFAPYARVQEENPGARDALRELIAHERRNRREAYIYVNNRLEGNAPTTIDAVV